MRRSGVVLLAVLAAAAVAGCGSTDAPHAGSAPRATIPHEVREACARQMEALRRRHPGAYLGACNYGTGTLMVPADPPKP